MTRPRKIVIATDLSSNSLHAVQYGCSLGAEFAADVHLFHVCNYPYAEFVKTWQQDFGSVYDEQEKQHAEAAEKQLGETDIAPLSDATRVIRSGFPIVEIPRYAEEVKADLLVLGTHGWTGLKHALMGSVCEAVVRTAKCAVLSIREK
jgi:nucleotide-binding universal stress UspA family protein